MSALYSEEFWRVLQDAGIGVQQLKRSIAFAEAKQLGDEGDAILDRQLLSEIDKAHKTIAAPLRSKGIQPLLASKIDRQLRILIEAAQEIGRRMDDRSRRLHRQLRVAEEAAIMEDARAEAMAQSAGPKFDLGMVAAGTFLAVALKSFFKSD